VSSADRATEQAEQKSPEELRESIEETREQLGETVEALAPPAEELSPLQAALHEKHGLPCGSCTPGVLTTMTWFLRQNPHPTPAEIRRTMSALQRGWQEGRSQRATAPAPGDSPFEPSGNGPSADGDEPWGESDGT